MQKKIIAVVNNIEGSDYLKEQMELLKLKINIFAVREAGLLILKELDNARRNGKNILDMLSSCPGLEFLQAGKPVVTKEQPESLAQVSIYSCLQGLNANNIENIAARMNINLSKLGFMDGSFPGPYEIAQTLCDLALYLVHKNIGRAHNKLAVAWLSTEDSILKKIISSYEQDQGSIGETSETYNELCSLYRQYLIELQECLEFCAYRENLEDKEPLAQRLIARCRRFEGFRGITHLAVTDIIRENMEFINKTLRHQSEQYIAPKVPRVDLINSINYAYDWLNNRWLPVDKDTMEAVLLIGSNDKYGESKYQRLAMYKASLEEGFRRGDMDVDVSIRLGKTYGEDAVVIRASMDEYLTKFIPGKTGELNMDLRYEGTENYVPGTTTSPEYKGFKPDKTVFYADKEALYVSGDRINARVIKKELGFLRASGFVEEKQIRLNNKLYYKFKILNTHISPKPIIIKGKEWSAVGLHNELHSILGKIYNSINS
ncbi:MAG: hypothetical protein PHV30_01520 [Candidatus Margulisbacteria bacterium]|nr:hypothetical protein [Candidatus Margulisiibacteriota bacterium]